MEPHIRTGKAARGSRHVLPLTLFFLTVCATSAQTLPFAGHCAVTSVPVNVRSEGVTERLGDIVLQCSGSNPGAVFSGNLTITLPVNVTNRVDNNNLTRDAVVSVDYGNGMMPTGVAGQVSNQTIAFNGLSLTAPASGNFNLNISGIRANISQLGPGSQQPVNAYLSSPLQVNQAQVIVGFTRISLLATLYETGISCYGSRVPSTISVPNLFTAGTDFASTRFTEAFSSAFQPRTPGADTGTRFLVKYSGFPANAHIYVPDMVAGSDAATPTAGGDLGGQQSPGAYVPGSGTLLLVRVQGADSTGAGGLPVLSPSGSGPITLNAAGELTLSGGSAYAVYEVVDANPTVQESVQFPTFIGLGSVTASAVAQETVSLAPISSAPAASTTAPIPRFAANFPPPSDCTSVGDCTATYFPKLMVDALPIILTAAGGTLTSAPGYSPIRNAAGGILEWSVSIAYLQGSGWLTVDNSSGVNSGSVRVWSQSQNLAPGSYNALITISAGAAGSQTIPVTLGVIAAPSTPPPPTPTPTPPATGPAVTVSKIVNAATLDSTPLVTGSLATIFGSNLTGKAVAVTFDGNPAALLYNSASQINLQVPMALASKATAAVVVTVDGSSSTPAAVALSPAWPSVFAHGVLNQDNSENTSVTPAQPGSILQIWGTGIPQGATISVTIGNESNLVPAYAGAAPGIAGVQQVDVTVPTDMPAGPAQLTVCASMGGKQYCSSGYPLTIGTLN